MLDLGEVSTKGGNVLHLDKILAAAAIAVVTLVLALPTCSLLLGSTFLAYAVGIAAAILALITALLLAREDKSPGSSFSPASIRGLSTSQADELGLRVGTAGALLGVSTWLVALGAFVGPFVIPALALALDVLATGMSMLALFFSLVAIAVMKGAEERRPQWHKTRQAMRVFSVGTGLLTFLDALAVISAFFRPDRFGWFELLAFLTAFVAMASALLSWDTARSIAAISIDETSNAKSIL
jgi:hypothetical protein